MNHILERNKQRKGSVKTMSILPPMQSTEQMKRITRKEFCENLDKILDIVSRDNVGYVITDSDNKDLVLCPVKWFDVHFDDDFGCMVNSAVKYAIGRASHIPDAVCRFVLKHIHVFDERTVYVLIRDIDTSLSDYEMPYRDTWVSLLNALKERLAEIREQKGQQDV